jgi:exopolysaccharide biosynthesis polyprenyl glycosylphosphotransferase
VSSAVYPEPIGYAPHVSRLIPGTASKRQRRKPRRSIRQSEAIGAAELTLPSQETPSLLRLRELLLPSPMRGAGEGWPLFRVVAGDYLVILGCWVAVRVLAGLVTPSTLSWRAASWTLFQSGEFRSGIIFAIIATLLAHSEGVYRPAEQKEKQTRALLKSVAWSSLLVWCTGKEMGSLLETWLFLGTVFLILVSLSVVRQIRRKWQCSERRDAKNVLIVGAGKTGRAVAAYLSEHPEMGLSFRGFLDDGGAPAFGVLGAPEDLGRIARAQFIDEVIVAVSDRRDLGQLAIREALRNRLDIKIIPDLFGAEAEDSVLESWGNTPLLTLHCERLPATRLFLKRALDIVISAGALVLTAPAMALVAALIRLDSRGPALYTAPRVGRKGRRFRCFKFRTMRVGADQHREALREKNQREGPCFKMAEDPRVTRVGRWLRRYSLDELPQLWNVLRGEMSLVGPRPHPLDDVARYELDHLRRLDVTPGLTGLWQISARQSRSFQTTLALDVEYIQKWTLWMDLRILFKTLAVVVQGTGV